MNTRHPAQAPIDFLGSHALGSMPWLTLVWPEEVAWTNGRTRPTRRKPIGRCGVRVSGRTKGDGVPRQNWIHAHGGPRGRRAILIATPTPQAASLATLATSLPPASPTP